MAESNEEGTIIADLIMEPGQTVILANLNECNLDLTMEDGSDCNKTSSPRKTFRSRKTGARKRRIPDPARYQCPFCEKGFSSEILLLNHQNVHTGVKLYNCDKCEGSFTSERGLSRHDMYKHSDERPFMCDLCNYSCVEQAKLTRHIRCHTGERPYQCPNCTYASAEKFLLKRHMRKHTGEQPYKCDVCNTKFTQQNSLKTHMLMHTGNKPVFKCEICPQTTTTKKDMRNHMTNMHAARNEPIVCKICGDSFEDKYKWKQHKQTHKGQKCFKCFICSFATKSQQSLTTHMRTHTGEKPYKCPDCEQNFGHAHSLRLHKKKCQKGDSTAEETIDLQRSNGKENEEASILSGRDSCDEALEGLPFHRDESPKRRKNKKPPKRTRRQKKVVELELVDLPAEESDEEIEVDDKSPLEEVIRSVESEFCKKLKEDVQEDVKMCFGFDEDDD